MSPPGDAIIAEVVASLMEPVRDATLASCSRSRHNSNNVSVFVAKEQKFAGRNNWLHRIHGSLHLSKGVLHVSSMKEYFWASDSSARLSILTN